MLDDGRGWIVKIPTIIISKSDGDKILKDLKHEVSLSMHF